MENFEHLKELMKFVGNITHHSSWDEWGNCTYEWTSEIPFKSMEELEEAFLKHEKRKQIKLDTIKSKKESFTYIYQKLMYQKYRIRPTFKLKD